jgi:serine/threonine protein kinase
VACPDDSQLRAYALGTFSAHDSSISSHVAGCTTCATKVMRVGFEAEGETKPLARLPTAVRGRITMPAALTVAPPKPVHKEGPLPKGTTVGRYIVQSELGESAMGRTYVALDPQLRRIALKVLHAGAEGSRGDSRLFRGAQAMAALPHPNVVAVQDVGRYEGRMFIAMELVEGTSLTTWLAQGEKAWRSVLDVFVEAGTGLAAAHATGLLHRDFMPSNVLIANDGRVRVSNFGIAPMVEAHIDVSSGSGGSSAGKRTVVVVGSCGYVAPEVLLGQAVDPRADQFSFAVSLYQALFGEPPFRGATYGEYFNAMKAGAPATPPNGAVPSWLFDAVRTGLQQKVNDRFPSMEAMLEALEAPKGLLGLFKR